MPNIEKDIPKTELSKQQVLNDLFVGTFNSILDVEQQALQNDATKDLSIAEIHTIDAIGVGEAWPMNVVAARLGITVATLSAAANRLVSKGYVDRERSEVDRRQVLICLTSKGRTAYRIHKHYHNLMVKAVTDGFSDEQEEILISALSNMKAFFDSNMASKDK